VNTKRFSVYDSFVETQLNKQRTGKWENMSWRNDIGVASVFEFDVNVEMN
jgi:hypothetical protein